MLRRPEAMSNPPGDASTPQQSASSGTSTQTPVSPPARFFRRVGNQLLEGLPDPVANSIRRHQWLWLAILAGLVAISGFIIQAIAEQRIQELYKEGISGWISATYPTWQVSNRMILGLVLGWGLFLVFVFISVLLLRSDAKRQARLQTAEGTVSMLTEKLDQAQQQVGAYTIRLEAAVDESRRISRALQRRNMEAKLLDIIRDVDSFLFLLMCADARDSKKLDRFVDGVLANIADLFPERIRSSVYIPDPNNPDYLFIRWSREIPKEAIEVNRWYIGNNHVPASDTPKRGIPGAVWRAGMGRVNPQVEADADFVEPAYNPPRPSRPYQSTLHALITPDDPGSKLGILAIDSLRHEFTPDDLRIVNQLATRLAWIMLWSQRQQNRVP
jgi:hypothetical protein